MAKTNIVIISSHSISDERFEAVYSLIKHIVNSEEGQATKGKWKNYLWLKTVNI